METNVIQVGADSWWLVRVGAFILLSAHIAGGTVGLLSGATALVVRKGRRLHALAGKTFVIAMIVMTSIGAIVAPFLVTAHGDPKYFDSLVAWFAWYLVLTGWLTVERKAGTIGRSERLLCLFVVLLTSAAVAVALRAADSPTGQLGGFSAGAYGVAATIFAVAALLDLKVIVAGGITGSPRIARHLWRMCLALFIAALSFFVGQQRVMPQFVQGSPLLPIPPLAVLVIMVFWLLKLRFSKALGRMRRRGLRNGRVVPLR